MDDFERRMIEDLAEIKIDLHDHMRRTEISEERHDRQDEINQAIIRNINQTSDRLVPLEKHHQAWVMLGKVAAALSPLVIALAVAWVKAKLWP